MDNPYAASAVNPISHSNQTGVTPAVMQALAGTKPWVRFCAVLGFIGCGFIFLAAVAMIGGGSMGMMSRSTGAGVAGGMMTGIALVYVILGLLYLIPSIKLWKYGSHIVNLLNSQSTADLEAALEAQRGFWKFVGVMMAIMLGIYALVFLVGMISVISRV